jgi:hypothetical protein
MSPGLTPNAVNFGDQSHRCAEGPYGLPQPRISGASIPGRHACFCMRPVFGPTRFGSDAIMNPADEDERLVRSSYGLL